MPKTPVRKFFESVFYCYKPRTDSISSQECDASQIEQKASLQIDQDQLRSSPSKISELEFSGNANTIIRAGGRRNRLGKKTDIGEEDNITVYYDPDLYSPNKKLEKVLNFGLVCDYEDTRPIPYNKHEAALRYERIRPTRLLEEDDDIYKKSKAGAFEDDPILRSNPSEIFPSISYKTLEPPKSKSSNHVLYLESEKEKSDLCLSLPKPPSFEYGCYEVNLSTRQPLTVQLPNRLWPDPLNEAFLTEKECLEIHYLSKNLTCILCSQVSEDFFMLQCFHYFCKNCVRCRVTKDYMYGLYVECPICTHKEIIQDKDDFFPPQYLKSMYQYYSYLMNKDDKKCDKHFEPTKATLRCKDCYLDMCKDCVKDHEFRYGNHTVQAFEHLKLEEIKKVASDKNKKCFIHGEELQYYCKTCRKPQCKFCYATVHLCHEKVQLIDLRDTAFLTVFPAKSKLCNVAADALIEVANNWKEWRRSVYENYVMVNRQVSERSKYAHTKVDQLEKRLYQMVTLKAFEHDQMYVNEILNVYEFLDVISSNHLKLLIIRWLANAVEAIVFEDYVKLGVLMCINAAHNMPVLQQLVSLEQVGEPFQKMGLVVERSKLMQIQSCSMTKSKLFLESISRFAHVTIASSIIEQVPHVTAYSTSHDEQKKWNQILKKCPYPRRVAFVKWGEETVLAVTNRFIDILDESKTVCNVLLFSPTDTEKPIEKLEAKRAKPFAICPASPEGFYYIDVGPDTLVKIHYKSKTAGRLMYFGTYDDYFFESPGHMCFSSASNKLVISDQMTQTVVVMNLVGAVMHLNKDFKDPKHRTNEGVCTDQNGNIYVAVYHKNAIYRLDPTGNTLGPYVTFNEGCYQPSDVKIFDNKLYCACSNGIRIFELDTHTE